MPYRVSMPPRPAHVPGTVTRADRACRRSLVELSDGRPTRLASTPAHRLTAARQLPAASFVRRPRGGATGGRRRGAAAPAAATVGATPAGKR
jgi:hypothetical protein